YRHEGDLAARRAPGVPCVYVRSRCTQGRFPAEEVQRYSDGRMGRGWEAPVSGLLRRVSRQGSCRGPGDEGLLREGWEGMHRARAVGRGVCLQGVGDNQAGRLLRQREEGGELIGLTITIVPGPGKEARLRSSDPRFYRGHPARP